MAGHPEQPQEPLGTAGRRRPRANAGTLAELERMLQGPEPATSQAADARPGQATPPPAATPPAAEVWADGRPKGWPTLQLRVRARPFDIYCQHPTDVTLDGRGIPVVNGHTVGPEDLARGWFSSR